MRVMLQFVAGGRLCSSCLRRWQRGLHGHAAALQRSFDSHMQQIILLGLTNVSLFEARLIVHAVFFVFLHRLVEIGRLESPCVQEHYKPGQVQP